MPTITLKQLKQQGRLSSGDIITHSRLGDCEVFSIETVSTITVQQLSTKRYYNLSGLLFPSATVQPATGRMRSHCSRA